MSYLHDYIRKKYVTCIFSAYQGIIFKKIAIFKFLIGFIHPKLWPTICLMLVFMIIYEKSMWHAYPLHTKAYKSRTLKLDTLYLPNKSTIYTVDQQKLAVAFLLILIKATGKFRWSIVYKSIFVIQTVSKVRLLELEHVLSSLNWQNCDISGSIGLIISKILIKIKENLVLDKNSFHFSRKVYIKIIWNRKFL